VTACTQKSLVTADPWTMTFIASFIRVAREQRGRCR
jgi:hypothetical protein